MQDCPMKLYWSPLSPFVRKTLVAVHELGLADRVEIIPTQVRMDTPNPAMLMLNPLGKIPALQLDDGAMIIDSFAIIDYLNEMVRGAIIPASGEARRQMLRQHALANGLMDILVLWRNERDKPVEQHSKGWIAGFDEKTSRVLALFEIEAAGPNAQPINLGQISIAVVLSYLDFRFAHLNWRDTHPALAVWHATFSSRPSMQATAIAP
jgi:glutathione S-transferase